MELNEVSRSTPLSRRFGIRQNGKIRCVDDFSRSGVNACCSTSESPRPHTIDVIAALCMSLVTTNSDIPWLSRSFDLKQAYRQCAVHPDSEKLAHIVVYCPERQQNMVFKMSALPFGNVRSVHSFLRMSACLFALAAAEFTIPVTSYFDDFVTICGRDEVKSVYGCMSDLFKLLGWRFAEQGDKAQPFADSVSALGVTVNVSNLHSGLVTIDNTASRKFDISVNRQDHFYWFFGQVGGAEVARSYAIRIGSDFWKTCKEGASYHHQSRLIMCQCQRQYLKKSSVQWSCTRSC